jgi:molybdenum cofactor biosynthesis enzyme MoaA
MFRILKKLALSVIPCSIKKLLAYFAQADMLKNLQIDVSDGCNLKCKMCVLKDHQAGRYKIMPDSIVSKLIAVAPRIKNIALQCNCEPLINKNIPAIISRLKKANPSIIVSLITNGTLLTRETSGELIEAQLDEMGVSIDSTDKDTFEAIRVGASLE